MAAAPYPQLAPGEQVLAEAPLGGGTAVLTGLSAGQIVVVGVQRVRLTSTTATGILALY